MEPLPPHVETTPAKLTQLPRVKLRLDRRRLVILLGLAILTIGLLLAVGGGREALAAIAGAKGEWLLLAIALHYSGFAMRGLRWQQLLRAMGHRLTWRYCMALLLSGWFVSALLPARAGDLLRIGILRMTDDAHPTVPVSDSFSSIILERTVDLSALVVLGAGAGFLLLHNELPTWVLWVYGLACVALLGLALTVLVLPRLLHWLAAAWRQPLWQRAVHFSIEILQSLRALGRQPGMTVVILLESFYIWLCDALLMWLVLKALGVTVALGTITFVALTVDIFAAVPFTPGGVGQIEVANAALLALLPLTASQITASVLLNRTISYWSFLLVSGIVTFAAGIGQLMPSVSETFGAGEDETKQ
ncbi:MAG TPA: lysylphosphatidylglycerol synthase transmembrane domain-containing protein [Caldilineaceae bacterium]|nr:lysylphosphatidylglycerol synthase transmembrane domain-containing protein [Caldilineaceae bacterium]